ncbi:DUF2087 domain-containing protein [Actinoplanes sp. RD1]|uniref:DUF2087 domain-containing protein n=1 Tax=Actinoplanes sp. RD1 TaxID=3064538 RepID=UPI0027421A2A|nr:DUF2087 domain-containing protein [Actinoplanes sp. RD1]
MSAEAARAAEILTQLAVPERLAAFAELTRRGKEGATLAELAYALDKPVQEVGKLLARLVGVGIATGTGNGVYRVKPGELREAAQAVDKAQPLAPLLAEYPALRGFFAHGRLTSLPPTQSERYPLVGELLTRYLALDALCDEETLNRRLAVVTDDVAAVRRMLVETGWLERDRAGTTYGPVTERPVTGAAG